MRDGWKGLDEASLKAAVGRHLQGKSPQIAVVVRDAAGLAEQLTGPAPTPPSYDSPKPAEVLEEDKAIAKFPTGITKENVRIVKYTDLFK
jgi:zinc protease